jgi:hypothetical protein
MSRETPITIQRVRNWKMAFGEGDGEQQSGVDQELVAGDAWR